MRSKKIISLLLAMVMCLSLLPISAVVEAADSVTFTALEGTAGANDDEGYEKLLDGKKTADDGTKWGVSNFSGAYIVMRASKAVVITGYTFTTGNDNTTATGRNPKDWVLYGSNDYNEITKAATWTAIHTVTNDTTMQNQNYASYSFTVDGNNTPYRYYKLEITANRGSTFMQLSEMELSWADAVTLTALDGTAGANDDEGYEKLLDGKKTADDGTKWGVHNFSSAYIVMKASKAVVITGYTFTTGDDNTTATGRNPKDWVLCGANDYDETTKTATWTAIHTVTNDTTMQDQNYASYSFTTDDNHVAYRYYKLQITANRGSTFMQLSEMELSWTDVAFSAVDGTENDKTSENYDKLLDGLTGTKWCHAVSAQPYIVIKSHTPTVLTGYRFTTANDNAGSGKQRNPKDWVLYGSKDYNESTKTGTWTVIDQKTDNTTMQDVNYTPYDFFINNRTAYTYYKLQITATPGDGLMQLSEMEFYYQTGELVNTVTFDKNGGDTDAVPNRMTVGTGLPTTNPTRNGYAFEGWYTQNGTGGNWGSAFTAESEVTEDITVYAKWHAAVITYDKNGGDTEAIPNTATVGDGLPLIEPTREGYYFGGWYLKDGTNDDWGAMFTISNTVTADMTVYARWYTSSVRKALALPSALPGAKYSALYFGRYPQSEVARYTPTQLETSQPTTGNEIGDWYKGACARFYGQYYYYYYQIEPLRWDVLSNDGEKMLLLTEKCVDNMRWSKDFYLDDWSTSSVRAFLNGYGTETDGSGNAIFEEDFSDGNNFIARAFKSAELPFIMQTDVSANEEPVLDRVFLLSYSDLENTALGLGSKSSLACEYTSFAFAGDRESNKSQWHSRDCDRSYLYMRVELDGTTACQDSSEMGSYYLVRPSITLDASKLVLASDKDSGKPAIGYLAPVAYKDNNTYKLTVLDESRSSFSHTYVSRSDSAVTINYTNAKSGSNEYISAVVINDDEVRSYGRLKNVKSANDTSGTLTVTLPANFDYFDGDRLFVFNEQINDETELDLSSALQEVSIMTDVPFVTYDKNGGETEAEPQKIYYGGGLPTTEPTWAKYEFMGWFTRNGASDGNWGEEFTADTVVTQDMTVYAKWQLIQVTFEAGDVTIEPDVSVKGQGEGIPATQPVKAGYSFGGWFTKDGTTGGDWGEEFTADTVAMKSMTVYAKWTPIDKNLTASFQILDGTAGNSTREGLNRLMDGNHNTKWCISGFTETSEAYVVVKASDPVYLQSYTFVTGNDNATYNGRNPKSWVLYACNDYNTETKTGTWTQLHSVTDDTTMQDLNETPYTFTVTGNATQYQYYKLHITKNAGADCMQLTELEMGYTRCPEHAWSVTSVAVTCLYEGYETHTCSLCGVSQKLVVASPLGHVSGADGKCSRCGLSPEARVDDVDYLTIQEAVNAAAGKTVTLLHSTDISSAIQINDTMTLDLNGYTINMVGNDRLIHVSGDNRAVFTLTDSSAAKTGALSGGNCSGDGGGVLVAYKATFNMTSGTIKNCKANSGGGIYASGSISITGGTVSGCTAVSDRGGGLYMDASENSVSLSDCIFENNTATIYGGAIATSRPLTLQNVTAKNNSAGRCGGGIYQYEKTLTLGSGVVIEGNFHNDRDSMYKEGGGIYGAGAAIIMNSGSIIRNNRSSKTGGGIALQGNNSKLTMNSGAVIQNNSAISGGGLYAQYGRSSGAVSLLNGGEIKENTADYGGGICLLNAVADINGCSVQNNSATNGGGAYVKKEALLNVKNGTIDNNTARRGAAIYMYDTEGDVNLSGGVISNNKAKTVSSDGGFAGGIYLSGSGTLTATGGEIKNNSADVSGGAIYRESNDSVINLSGLEIRNNTAVTKGGGIYCQGTAAVGLTDMSITGNTAAVGGGVVVTDSFLTINSGVTITGNTLTAAAGTTGAASNLYLPTGKVVTVTENTVTSGTESTTEGTTTTTPTATRVGVTLEDGTGNITAESETDYSAYFTSDVSGYVVSYADGVVKLGLPAPKLTLTQNAVTAENVPEGATLFVAAYSGGKLLSLYRGAAVGGTTALNTLGLDLTGADRLSAFMWNGTSLSPLCANTSITLGTD